MYGESCGLESEPRGLLLTSLWRGPGSLVRGAAEKSIASDTAPSVASDAVSLLGGYGFTKEFPVERSMLEATITQIYEGTNQIQRIVVAKHLLS